MTREIIRTPPTSSNASPAYDSSNLTQNELYDLTRAVKHSIARFTDCPDEAIWEEASALGDMFRK